MIYHFFSSKYLHLSPKIIESILECADQTNVNGFDDFFIVIETTGNKIFPNKSQIEIYKKITSKYGFNNYMFIDSKWKLFSKILSIKSSEKIFFHSALNLKVMVLINTLLYLLRLKKKAKSFNYICWGNDFGFCKALNNVDSIIKRFIARVYETVWPWYGRIIALVPMDAQKLKNAYKSNNIATIPYLNTRLISPVKKEDRPLKIMVSHSGWPHNNHLASFEFLKRFKDEDIEIICPLCYGDPEYIDKIIKVGSDIFGNKFSYFTELMDKDDYLNLTKKNHIYVTAAEIQTGLGAIHMNIEGNAKIFLKENLFNSIKEEGFKVFHFDELADISFNDLKEPLGEDNFLKIMETKQNVLKSTILKWKTIYS